MICARTGLRVLHLDGCRGQSAAGEAEFVRCVAASALARMQHLTLTRSRPSAAFVASLAKLTRLSALLFEPSEEAVQGTAAVACDFSALPQLRSFEYEMLRPQPRLQPGVFSRLRSLVVSAYQPKGALPRGSRARHVSSNWSSGIPAVATTLKPPKR